MATKTKAQLKDVFNGPSSLFFQSAELGTPMVLDPEYDVPVKVDTIEFEQGEPTIDHYKVIGLAGDWVSSSEAGDITVSFRVPTKHTDILKLAFGSDAVKESQSLTYGSATFAGDGVILKNKKIQGTWAILNDAGDQLLILNNTALYASMVMDTDAKGVVAIDFNGTIESDGTNPDILFLKKQA